MTEMIDRVMTRVAKLKSLNWTDDAILGSLDNLIRIAEAHERAHQLTAQRREPSDHELRHNMSRWQRELKR